MRTHMRLHKEKQPCECSLCEFVAESTEALQDHMLQHCKVRTYQCKLCPSIFNYKSQLRAHMRAHNYSCEKCSFETTNVRALDSHSKSHNAKENIEFVCDQCNDVFDSEELLAQHIIECNSIVNGDEWQCKHCDFVTSDAVKQQQHLMTHSRVYKCELCEFTTSSYVTIRNHCMEHEPEKSLKCALCDFIASSTRSLKSHMKRHVNDQRFVQQPLEQYKCNLCGYVCHHLPSLKSHMWRHSSNSNYSYNVTNDVINAAIDNQNQRVPGLSGSSQGHSNPGKETTYKDASIASNTGCFVTFRCCQCGFESSQKSLLNEHMSTHLDIIKKTLEVNQSQLLPSTGKVSVLDKPE